MKAETDYKKQIRELQSALATERQKNTAMAKGLIPKEYLHKYARIQIEKDREDCSENVPINKLWSDDRKAVKDFIKNRPINLE